MRLRGLSVLLSIAACGTDTQPAPHPMISIRDSIRVRREARIASRPDTFGTRVDSMRILAPPSAVAAPWVIVISDFQCGRCRDFALSVLSALRHDIAERGIARLAFVNYPQEIHFSARFAAHAALCAASAGRFWEMHDSLFSTQSRWDRLPDPRAFMDSLAEVAGVPREVQRRCTERQSLLRLLDGDVRRSEQAGAGDPPTVLVGQRRLPPSELSLEGVRRAIAEEAARSR